MNRLGLSAGCVTKRLAGSHDPQALFAKLSRSAGQAQAPLLFHKSGGLALVLTSAALKLRCSNCVVTLTACHDGALPLIDAIENRLGQHLVGRAGGELTLRFPRSDDADEEVRLLTPSPYTPLRTILSILKSDQLAEPLAILLLGIIAFDHIDMFERLPPRAEGPDFPDFEFWLADGLVAIEHDGSARIITMAVQGSDPAQAHLQHHLACERLVGIEKSCLAEEPPQAEDGVTGPADPFDGTQCDMSDAEFEMLVKKLKAHVIAGDIFQIVPSRSFRRSCPDPLGAFEQLGRADPSAYRFYLQSDWGVLFGASPERAVRVKRGANGINVQVCPIAGTRPRGKSVDQDGRLEAELALDDKETAEHLMLVDLARNDVARVSRTGSRRVTRLMDVQKFASVMHLVSTVEGELGIGLDAFDALRAAMNVGTLSGAPKLRAIELIRRYEPSPRGPYGGAVAWINGEGDMDSCVVIRSALVSDGIASVRAGAGIVHDSIPAMEAAETRYKASAVLGAIAAACP